MDQRKKIKKKLKIKNKKKKSLETLQELLQFAKCKISSFEGKLLSTKSLKETKNIHRKCCLFNSPIIYQIHKVHDKFEKTA